LVPNELGQQLERGSLYTRRKLREVRKDVNPRLWGRKGSRREELEWGLSVEGKSERNLSFPTDVRFYWRSWERDRLGDLRLVPREAGNPWMRFYTVRMKFQFALDKLADVWINYNVMVHLLQSHGYLYSETGKTKCIFRCYNQSYFYRTYLCSKGAAIARWA
jgi:hypothetical protein